MQPTGSWDSRKRYTNVLWRRPQNLCDVWGVSNTLILCTSCLTTVLFVASSGGHSHKHNYRWSVIYVSVNKPPSGPTDVRIRLTHRNSLKYHHIAIELCDSAKGDIGFGAGFIPVYLDRAKSVLTHHQRAKSLLTYLLHGAESFLRS